MCYLVQNRTGISKSMDYLEIARQLLNKPRLIPPPRVRELTDDEKIAALVIAIAPWNADNEDIARAS